MQPATGVVVLAPCFCDPGVVLDACPKGNRPMNHPEPEQSSVAAQRLLNANDRAVLAAMNANPLDPTPEVNAADLAVLGIGEILGEPAPEVLTVAQTLRAEATREVPDVVLIRRDAWRKLPLAAEAPREVVELRNSIIPTDRGDG